MNLNQRVHTKEQLIEYYKDKNKLSDFKKLNVWWIAKIYSDKNLLKVLHNNIVYEIEKYLPSKQKNDPVWRELKDTNSKFCRLENWVSQLKRSLLQLMEKLFII